MNNHQGRLNDFENKKVDQYKQENPVHKYRNGKKSSLR